MKSKIRIAALVSLLILYECFSYPSKEWIIEKHSSYLIYYTASDKSHILEYNKLIDEGIISTISFFKDTFKNRFVVNVHPNRKSLDAQWQNDWNMPSFKSECWMVASGIAARLDIISPSIWDTESCEHNYSDKNKTQALITHELIHVFHGQFCKSKDFGEFVNMDWFVEGLASYASGQCDSSAIAEVKKAYMANSLPDKLDKFWTGKLRYSISGAVVMFIDKKFGRNILKEVMKCSKLTEVLILLKCTEPEFISEFKMYITSLS